MKKTLKFIILFFIFKTLLSCDQIKLKDIKTDQSSIVTDDKNNTNKILVYITESNIIKPQKVGSDDVLDYVHNKVLRGSLNFIKSNALDSIIVDGTFADSTQTKKVFLEYFTGSLCGNCPKNTKPVFEDIELNFKNKVNIIKLHASDFFSTPRPGKYSYDFRSDVGESIKTAFGIQAVPIGMIDRIDFQGSSRLISPTDWTSKIQLELEKSNNYGIWESHVYQSQNREIISTVKVKDLTTKRLYGINFRGNLNEGWNSDNCHLVFVLFDINGNVIQSIEKKII